MLSSLVHISPIWLSPSSLGFRLGVLCLVALVFAGCGAEDEAPEDKAAPPPASAEPSAEGTAEATCTSVSLARSAARPSETVVVTGVPAALGDSLYAIVYAPADSVQGLAMVRRVEATRAEFRVPLHPSLRVEGGDATLTLTNGTTTCPEQAFTIEALPDAPGTTAAVMDTVLALSQRYAELFGVEDAEFRSAPFGRLPAPVVPMAVARRVLGERSDPDSRLGRLERTPPGLRLADAMLAQGRALEVLSAQLAQARRADPLVDAAPGATGALDDGRNPQSPRLPVRTASLGATVAPSASRPSRPPRPTPASAPAPAVTGQCPDASPTPSAPTRRVSCNGAAATIASPLAFVGSAQELSDLMNLSLAASISLDPDVVKYLDAAISTVELGGAGFGFSAALIPGKPNKALSGGLAKAFGSAAAYLEIVKLVREAESKVLPRHLAGLNVDMAPIRYREDDDTQGRISSIRLRAASEGWKLDRTLMNALLSKVDVPWSKGLTTFLRKHGASDVTQEVSESIVDELFAELFTTRATDTVTENGASTGVFACIPSKTYSVSILDEAWSEIGIIEGASIQRAERLTYEPVDTGTSRFRVSSTPPSGGVMRFGAQMAKTCPAVTVEEIQVLMTPPAKRVEPGEEVVVEAEVTGAVDPSVRWSIDQGDGTILTTRQIGSNLHQARILVPDPMRDAVVVRATSTADRSHLASADEVRSATARLHGEPMPVAGVCTPETMQQAVNEAYSGNVVLNPSATDPRDMQVPNPVRVRTGGLMADNGVACSHHVGALSEDAAADLGLITTDEALDQQAARDNRSVDALERLDSLADAGETGGAAMMGALSDLNASRAPSKSSPRHVVFQVYSPSILTMQSMGYLDDPRSVAHGGLAGWNPNAAMLVHIHLPGTVPEDLAEGQSYSARAYAPGEGVPDTGGVLPTRSGFYTRWSGRTVPAPGCPSAEGRAERQRELEACRALVAQNEKIRQQLADVGRAAETKLRTGQEGLTSSQKALAESFIPDLSQPLNRGVREAIDCKAEVGMTAFSGETEVVTGAMAGTVTIQSITNDAITGRFELRGTGQRKRDAYTLRTCDDGTVSGHRIETETQSGPISISGELRAPNHSPGLYRVHFVTVSVDAP